MKPSRYQHYEVGQPVHREPVISIQWVGTCPRCKTDCSIIKPLDGESWQTIPCVECGVDFVVDFDL